MKLVNTRCMLVTLVEKLNVLEIVDHLFTSWFYGHLRILAPLIMDAHSSLLTVFFYQV